MWLNKLLLAFWTRARLAFKRARLAFKRARLAVPLLLIPGLAMGAIHVNSFGDWKQPKEIHINDGGTWKAALEVHVNNGGTWARVYLLGYLFEFEWEYEDIEGIDHFTIWLNDAALCTVSTDPLIDAVCLSPTPISRPTKIYMTAAEGPDWVFIDGIWELSTTDTLPSNAIWVAGYPDWKPSTAYALDDKVSAGDGWSYSAPMKVTTAGTSGATEPTWPVLKYISGTVVDNGDGTVNIPSIAHGFVAGNDITITGTDNYDATYTLGTQASADNITVTATYVAEDVSGTVVDKTVIDGTVTWELTYE